MKFLSTVMIVPGSASIAMQAVLTASIHIMQRIGNALQPRAIRLDPDLSAI